MTTPAASLADQIRVNTPVRTRGITFCSLFDRWGRPALSRGVAITNPLDSIDGSVVSVRLEDGSVLPYGVDELEPVPPSRPERGPLASASDADVAREFWRRFGPCKVLIGTWGKLVAYAELNGTDAAEDWMSGRLHLDEEIQDHASGENGFVAAIERARELARGVR